MRNKIPAKISDFTVYVVKHGNPVQNKRSGMFFNSRYTQCSTADENEKKRFYFARLESRMKAKGLNRQKIHHCRACDVYFHSIRHKRVTVRQFPMCAREPISPIHGTTKGRWCRAKQLLIWAFRPSHLIRTIIGISLPFEAWIKGYQTNTSMNLDQISYPPRASFLCVRFENPLQVKAV
jgi:hypothetical protein